MKNKIKLVALDLDGTTLNHNKEISPRTVSAFHRAMEEGVHIVISTGRTLKSLPQQLNHIDGLEYVITSNGAHITKLENLEKIYEDYIPEESIVEIVDILRKIDISIETFVEGRAYIEKSEYDDIVNNGSSYRDVEYIVSTRNPINNILDFMLKNKQKIENISLNFPDLEDKEQFRKTLEKVNNITITSSFPHNYEIGGNCTSKAQALRFLMDLLDVKPEELMACGDSQNDLEMIKLAGIGVAMANASQEVKDFADFVTDANTEDGVAKAIERFAL